MSTERGKAALTETRDPAPELQTQERESREQENTNDATRSHGAKDSPGVVPPLPAVPSASLDRRPLAARDGERILGPEAGAWTRVR